MAEAKAGTLFVIATPIGNLEDVTIRAARVLGEVESRLDRHNAMARRDYWLRMAHDLLGAEPGNVRLLADALARYHATTWPCVRHLAAPRAEDRPLHRAFFMACQAADDAGANIPGYRQIRRLVT